MIDCQVAINYRPGVPVRDALYLRVKQWWEHWAITYASIHPVVTVDSGVAEYSRGGSFNQAAHGTEAACLILTDADVIPNAHSVAAAAYACLAGTVTAYPWQRYVRLAEDATPPVLKHIARTPMVPFVATAIDAEWTMPSWSGEGAQSVGPLMVVDREAYLRLGGCDPRFTGWGFEDAQWHKALTLLPEPAMVRLPGQVLHLWHPANPDSYGQGSAIYERNAALAKRYDEAETWTEYAFIRGEAAAP